MHLWPLSMFPCYSECCDVLFLINGVWCEHLDSSLRRDVVWIGSGAGWYRGRFGHTVSLCLHCSTSPPVPKYCTRRCLLLAPCIRLKTVLDLLGLLVCGVLINQSKREDLEKGHLRRARNPTLPYLPKQFHSLTDLFLVST